MSMYGPAEPEEQWVIDLRQHRYTAEVLKQARLSHQVLLHEMALAFDNGYLQAMDLMIAHWPEDRKCKCDPVMSGGTKPPCMLAHVPHSCGTIKGQCWNYCWVKEIHRTAAVNAGEDEEYANTSPY